MLFRSEDTVLRVEQHLKAGLRQRVRDLQQRVDLAANSYVFREPGNLVRTYRQDVHAAETRIADLLKFGAQQRRQRLSNAGIVMTHRLQAGMQRARQQIDRMGTALQHRMVHQTAQERQRLTRMEDQLRILNPVAVLGRGYSLTRRSDGSVVRSAGSVDIGEQLITQFAVGKVVSNVAEKE